MWSAGAHVHGAEHTTSAGAHIHGTKHNLKAAICKHTAKDTGTKEAPAAVTSGDSVANKKAPCKASCNNKAGNVVGVADDNVSKAGAKIDRADAGPTLRLGWPKSRSAQTLNDPTADMADNRASTVQGCAHNAIQGVDMFNQGATKDCAGLAAACSRCTTQRSGRSSRAVLPTGAVQLTRVVQLTMAEQLMGALLPMKVAVIMLAAAQPAAVMTEAVVPSCQLQVRMAMALSTHRVPAHMATAPGTHFMQVHMLMMHAAPWTHVVLTLPTTAHTCTLHRCAC